MGKHSADAERFAAACAGANTDLVALRRLIARRGQVWRISAACWPVVTRSRSIPFTSRSAETPPHPRPPMRDEIFIWISTQEPARTRHKLASDTANPRGARSSNASTSFLHACENTYRTSASYLPQAFRPAITPPSTGRIVPVIQPASSLAKNRIANTTSCGCPVRPSRDEMR